MNPEVTKIVKVIIKEDASRYAVSQPIYKEDYGLHLLLIEGIELPEAYAVDFSSSETHGTSVTMIGNADGVLIPKQFIDTGKDIFAFLYITGEDFGRTVYKFRIPNRFRPDRTNDEPEPEEQSVIDQAIAALNSAVEKTAQDVIDSDANANRAEEAAQLASDKADEADAHANRAEASESNTQQYAERAENAADSAESDARTASQKADEANQSAQEAETSANRAEQAARKSGYMFFYINENGDLIYRHTGNTNVDFYLRDGDLYVRAKG